MILFLLKRRDTIGYDEYQSHVVAADDESTARLMAAEHPGDEGATIWFAPSTEAMAIGLAVEGTKAGIVLASFCAG